MPATDSDKYSNGFTDRWIVWLPVAAIGALLLLSLVFYRERMLFIDAPHILFRISNNGALQITEHRYGSFITQLFPLAGSWLHLPLPSPPVQLEPL